MAEPTNLGHEIEKLQRLRRVLERTREKNQQLASDVNSVLADYSSRRRKRSSVKDQQRPSEKP
ncbi:MAG TPA: hypothetical protein VE621_23490 [Bryobacteraceae bacterium]|jgi:hypothetical protein|nr:hypothetical protein [Bryobacteraceae bacterium]